MNVFDKSRLSVKIDSGSAFKKRRASCSGRNNYLLTGRNFELGRAHMGDPPVEESSGKGGEDGMRQGRKRRTDTYVKNTNAFNTRLCPTDLDSRLQGGWVRGHKVAPATRVKHSSPGVNESMATICSIQQPSAMMNKPREIV